MDRQRRSGLVIGILLILLGGLILAFQLVPSLRDYIAIELSWPLIIVGIGVLFLVFAVLSGVPELAVPATILGGIGLLLYWTNATNNWEGWAYIWTLIPGFVGLGIILAGLLGGQAGNALRGGVSLIVISGILFVIFSSFLGGPVSFGAYWPVLLILLGIWLLLRPWVHSRSS